MRSNAATIEEYIASLPEERKKAMTELRKVILKNIPKGFSEEMGYGMMGYVVPHSLYPKGYHCDPKQPLPFMGMASQKNFIAVYHMGIYSVKNYWIGLRKNMQNIPKQNWIWAKAASALKNPTRSLLRLSGNSPQK